MWQVTYAIPCHDHENVHHVEHWSHCQTHIYIFWGLIPNTGKWTKRIWSPNKFFYIILHVQICLERQQVYPDKRELKKYSHSWSWGRQFWLAIIHYILPSTTPHQNTECLPSPHRDFHLIHTRNYTTALHIQVSLQKECTSTIPALP
jgi:hypothetical protein